MEHRGEIVEQAIRKSGYSISKIAEKLGKSRRWMYLMFDNPNVALDIILEIGNIIHVDFSNDIKAINKVVSEPQEKYGEQQKDIQHWKDKYYALLEEHLELLKKLKAQ